MDTLFKELYEKLEKSAPMKRQELPSASLVEEEYDYNKIKNEVFDSLNGNGEVLLKQIFNEKEKKLLLQTVK